MEAEDFLYVGYLTPFNEIEVIPYSDNNQNVSVLTAKYWNGVAWQTLTIADGTSDAGKTFRKRGKSTGLPANWKQNGPLEGAQPRLLAAVFRVRKPVHCDHAVGMRISRSLGHS